MPEDATSIGHAFISYVREDSEAADDLEALLTEARIPVWRDTKDLWPGEDWRTRIREAITNGAFAFIPIFTERSQARSISGQWEELYYAADEMRRRPPGTPWIFPVRFADCDVPRLNLGGGRLLSDIQRVDLFGPGRGESGSRLVASVRRILDEPAATPQVDAAVLPRASAAESSEESRDEQRIKQLLRDPDGDIQLHDLLAASADRLEASLVARVPDGDVFAIADNLDRDFIDLDELLRAVVIAGQWSREDDRPIWRRLIERVARSCDRRGDRDVDAGQRCPLAAMVYAAGLASLSMDNFGLLRSVAVDARVVGRDGSPVAAVTRSRPIDVLSGTSLSAQVAALRASGEDVDAETVEGLARGTRGSRYTPVSDYLHDRLRRYLAGPLPDDGVYSSRFDELEMILALLVTDQQLVRDEAGLRTYIPDPYMGRFVWRETFREEADTTFARLHADLLVGGANWAPLLGGLFGGDDARAQAAFVNLEPTVARMRDRVW